MGNLCKRQTDKDSSGNGISKPRIWLTNLAPSRFFQGPRKTLTIKFTIYLLYHNNGVYRKLKFGELVSKVLAVLHDQHPWPLFLFQNSVHSNLSDLLFLICQRPNKRSKKFAQGFFQQRVDFRDLMPALMVEHTRVIKPITKRQRSCGGVVYFSNNMQTWIVHNNIVECSDCPNGNQKFWLFILS